MRAINASEFKAKCLAILDEIAQTGEGVTILKRGRPIVEILPAIPRDKENPQESLTGTVKIHGDIVGSALPPDDWEAERGSE